MERALSRHLPELRDLVSEHSITRSAPGEPDFVLTSGSKTRYYCDAKRVTLSPRGSWLIAEILFELLKDRAEAIGGLQLGATFIAAAVALLSAQRGRPIYGFTVRSEAKTHGTKESVAASFHPDGRELLSPGRPVAVVDDVVTKAGSILKAIAAVQERGCKIVAVVSIVDRNEGGSELLRSMGLPYFSLLNAREPGEVAVNDDLLDPSRL